MKEKIINVISWVIAIFMILLVAFKNTMVLSEKSFNIIMGINLMIISIILLLKNYLSNKKFNISYLIVSIIFFAISLYYLFLI